MPLTDTNRLARLEAESAIRDLKYEYANLCDSGYDGQALGRLFTEDAVWDGGKTFGRYEGRPAIEEFFSGLAPEFVWAVHYMVGPRFTDVSEDATTAAAGWYLWMPFLEADGDAVRSMLLIAKQHDTYRQLDGAWRFSGITVTVESIGTADQGWSIETVQKDLSASAHSVSQ